VVLGHRVPLQTGRSRVRLPVVSLEIFIDIIPGVDSVSNRNEG